MGPPAELTTIVSLGRMLGFSLLFYFERCFSHVSLLLFKRHSEQFQERLGFFVGFSRGCEYYIHTSNFLDLVIDNFRKDQLLFYSHRKVSSSVKGIFTDSFEISYSGKCNRKKLISKFIHALASKSNLCTYRHAFAELKVSYRFA